MRILVTGDRQWSDEATVRSALEGLAPVSTIIEGEAMGLDSMARDIAREIGLSVMPYYADWSYYGRAAGPIRNNQMLENGKPDQVWAFHNDLPRSLGTLNMVKQALASGHSVWLFQTDKYPRRLKEGDY